MHDNKFKKSIKIYQKMKHKIFMTKEIKKCK